MRSAYKALENLCGDCLKAKFGKPLPENVQGRVNKKPECVRAEKDCAETFMLVRAVAEALDITRP